MQPKRKQVMQWQEFTNVDRLQAPEAKTSNNQLKEFFNSRIESALRGNYRDVDVSEIIKATIEKSKCNK